MANKKSLVFLMLIILFMPWAFLTGCSKEPEGSKEPEWKIYYNDIVEILAPGKHNFEVISSPSQIDGYWGLDPTDPQWEGVLGITMILGYQYQYENDFVMVKRCDVYIFSPDVATIYHEMVHVWDAYHYFVYLEEFETSYLAYKLMDYSGYEKEARLFYNQSMARNDEYSFKKLTEEYRDKINTLYDMIIS